MAQTDFELVPPHTKKSFTEKEQQDILAFILEDAKNITKDQLVLMYISQELSTLKAQPTLIEAQESSLID